MGQKQEAVIREFLSAWGDGVRAPDIDKLASMLAPEGYWELYIPGGPIIRGPDALRAEIQRQLSYVSFPHCTITHITSSESQVCTERIDTFIRNGKTVRHPLMAIFELDEQNLITAWREYFDTSDLARQTGADPARLSGLES